MEMIVAPAGGAPAVLNPSANLAFSSTDWNVELRTV
jgi:hypothetical protein